MCLPYYPPNTIAIAVAWSMTLVSCSKILPSERISPLALMFPLAVIFVNSNSPASTLLPVPSFLVTLVEKLPLSAFRLVTLVEKLPLSVFKPDILDVIAVNLIDTLELSANKFVPKILPLELISDEAVMFVDDTCSM